MSAYFLVSKLPSDIVDHIETYLVNLTVLIEEGNKDRIEWFHRRCPTSEHWNKYYWMDLAAKWGHLEELEWLHTNRTEGCTYRAMDRAAEEGHLETVKWLHTNRREGCTTWAMDSAAGNGHLEVVQWLHANRTEGCTTQAMDWADEEGHSEVVKWLRNLW